MCRLGYEDEYAWKLAANWAAERKAAQKEVAGALQKAQLTMEDVMAETLEGKIESFERFDRLLASSEARRNNALREIERVTRPGGLLVTLDFFLPANAVLRHLYVSYLYVQGGFWGLLLHGRPRIYTYIPDSLRSFISMQDFADRLRSFGYAAVEAHGFIFGGIGLHWAAKKENPARVAAP